LLTDQLLFASKEDIGGVRGVTILKQTTPSKAVLCSQHYIAGHAGRAGQASLNDMIVTGEGTNAASHGIILRDYFSQIERTIITDCGCNGPHMTTMTVPARPRVARQWLIAAFTEVDTRNCHG
jgi:hypothetical protein